MPPASAQTTHPAGVVACDAVRVAILPASAPPGPKKDMKDDAADLGLVYAHHVAAAFSDSRFFAGPEELVKEMTDKGTKFDYVLRVDALAPRVQMTKNQRSKDGDELAVELQVNLTVRIQFLAPPATGAKPKANFRFAVIPGQLPLLTPVSFKGSGIISVSSDWDVTTTVHDKHGKAIKTVGPKPQARISEEDKQKIIQESAERTGIKLLPILLALRTGGSAQVTSPANRNVIIENHSGFTFSQVELSDGTTLPSPDEKTKKSLKPGQIWRSQIASTGKGPCTVVNATIVASK